MERLTYDFCVGNKHCWQVKGADNLECREVCRNQGEKGCTDCPIAKAFDRLAAYEETGLDPEEIERILDSYGRGMTLRTENAQRLGIIKEISTNRLRELAQAENKGTCGIPPVRLHQHIFRVFNGAIKEEIVCNAMWEPFAPIPRCRIWVLGGGLPYYWADVFSKTVFLTREAAEAALKEMEAEYDR